MKPRRREQATKGGNKQLVNAMQGKRFSNAAGPHAPKTNYKRKPKHVNKGWD